MAIRDEVILAIAEHDNGWWEWEAFPTIDESDGLPINLPEVAARRPADGLRRWELGIPRLAVDHPYAALLTNRHAYWLYTFAFDPAGEPAFRHPLFGSPDTINRVVGDRGLTEPFLKRLDAERLNLVSRVQSVSFGVDALADEQLNPHLRLLQVLDAASLLISYGVDREQTLVDVPRAGWPDRVGMTWKPLGDRRIQCDPYPFDLDPLPVFLPLRTTERVSLTGLPMSRLHSIPLTTIRFELTS